MIVPVEIQPLHSDISSEISRKHHTSALAHLDIHQTAKMAAPEEPKSTIAILSIGDMGGSIARLLISKGFRIVTDVTGRRYLLPPPLLTFPHN